MMDGAAGFLHNRKNNFNSRTKGYDVRDATGS